MARARGIYGFEMGDLSGLTGSGVSAANMINDSASARSGNYRYNSKVTVATQNHAVTFTLGTATAGTPIDTRLRVYFRPITFPGTSGLVIARLGPLQLEMSTTGTLRLVGVGTTSAYQGSTTLNHWYRAELHCLGLERTGGVTNSTRVRGQIDVYDMGTDGLTETGLPLSI